MTTFDDREKAFERKFAMDQDLRFKAEARRNKLLAEWAGAKLGITGAALEDYIKAVRKADLAEKGDEDVVRKLRKDFDDKGIKVSDDEIRSAMMDFIAAAVQQVESQKSS
ncbi:MAG: DUF1476 domain-containing protein [Hyphomicrobiaceae bacterium]